MSEHETLIEIFKLLRAHGEDLAAIKKQLELTKPCPNPGLCLNIEREVEAMKLTNAKIAGGAVVIMGLSSILGAIGSWMVMFLTSKH